MKSSFKNDDVTLLLKDITGLVKPLPTEEREKLIQSGIHYSQMLPLEYKPTEKYIQVYEESLKTFGQATADAVAAVSDKIVDKKGSDGVIVSLARAGTPVGILVRRYIRKKYGYDYPHYSISIIRDRGIDENAMRYILDRHAPESIQFLDGWTGKGVIYRELQKDIGTIKGVDDTLAVLADPAGLTDMCGTHEDILIPSSCLNCTICGLISRTFLRDDIIGKHDFHGAAYYGELADEDRTYEFINYIESLFRYDDTNQNIIQVQDGMTTVKCIAKKEGIDDINLIKPGIGETTRVLLRRVPWKIIINNRFQDDAELNPVKRLALEKKVPIVYGELDNYKCCGIIRQISDV
jgi:hypothetical protein